MNFYSSHICELDLSHILIKRIINKLWPINTIECHSSKTKQKTLLKHTAEMYIKTHIHTLYRVKEIRHK